MSWYPGILNKEHTRTKNNLKRQKGELPLLPTHTTHLYDLKIQSVSTKNTWYASKINLKVNLTTDLSKSQPGSNVVSV